MGLMDNTSSYVITGADFRVTLDGESTTVGSIVQGIADATLGVGDSIKIERVA